MHLKCIIIYNKYNSNATDIRYVKICKFLFCTNLKESGENVKLKNRNVVVAGEVNGGLQGHGLQA